MESNFFLDNINNRIILKLVDLRLLCVPLLPACYAIENNKTGCFYVGSTNNVNLRLKDHLSQLERSVHGNRNLQKNYDENDKDNFIVHISLETSVENAQEREQCILNEGINSGILFNIASNAVNPLAANSIPQFSKSKEGRILASNLSKERWKNSLLRSKMISSMGENIVVDGVEYNSVREASRETGVAVQTIRSRLHNGNCSLLDIRPKTRKVICEGKIYSSLSEAAAEYGINLNTMIARLKSKSPLWKDFNYSSD